MEDEESRNKLLAELQKYIPFLEAMIANLQNASNTQEKPRSAQLDKMKSLLGLLTNKNRKMKIGTLQKCEEVLRKLHEKMEMNGSSKFQIVCKSTKMDPVINSYSENIQNIHDSPLNTIISKLNIKNTSAPASPSPPLFQTNINAPIIIPTERLSDSITIDNEMPINEQINRISTASGSADSLYTRRERKLYSENSLFHRRSKSPSSLDRNISPRRPVLSPRAYNNDWEDLTDEEYDLKQKRRDILYDSPEPLKRSVFDRLGQKVVSDRDLNSPNPHGKFTPLGLSIPVKVPKSATLITNLTNQIKKAQIEQDIASDIAVYLSESEKNITNEKQSDKPVHKNAGEKCMSNSASPNISCGIKKSTPSLKAVPVRKIQEGNIFGDVLSKIDKEIIDHNKIPKRKSTDTKLKKDSNNSPSPATKLKDNSPSAIKTDKEQPVLETESVKMIKPSGFYCSQNSDVDTNRRIKPIESKSEKPVSSETKIGKTEINQESPITKTPVSINGSVTELINTQVTHIPSSKEIKSSSSKSSPLTISETISPVSGTPDIKERIVSPRGENNSTLHTSINFERLSDKYPRKKSTETHQPENVGLKTMAKKPIISSLKSSATVEANNINKTADNDKSKQINIPDIKLNDPRMKKNKSPMREIPFCARFDSIRKSCDNDETYSELQSNRKNAFAFPSIVDMDYRYIPQQNTPTMPVYPPQPNVFSSNCNFMPQQPNLPNFNVPNIKPALLPTPKYGMNNFNNENNLLNPTLNDQYTSPSSGENRRSDFYKEYPNKRLPNDLYGHPSQDAFKANISTRESGYSAPPHQYTPRPGFSNRGRGGGEHKSHFSRENRYRWNVDRNDSSRNNDYRHNTRLNETKQAQDKETRISNSSTKSSRSDALRFNTNRDNTSKFDTKKLESDRNLSKVSTSNVKNSNSRDRSSDRNKKQSPSRRNSHEGAKNHSFAIKSYKIPKIKRDSPPRSDNNVAEDEKEKNQATCSKDNKSLERCEKIDVSKKEGIDNLPKNECTDSSHQSHDSCDNKLEIPVSTEETAIMTKLLDILTKVCQDKTTIQNKEHLNVLQKLRETIDPKKFEKIQKILDTDSEVEETGSAESAEIESPITKRNKRRVKVIETDSSDDDTTDTSKPSPDEKKDSSRPKTPQAQPKKTKRRNALEMLQHDVRDMFISQGVLTATGRRMCRALKEDNDKAFNALPIKDDNKILTRRSRASSRKIDYCEETDQSAEENKETCSPVAQPIFPRIIIEKLKPVRNQSVTRGRNVARRGRVSGSFTRKIIGNETEVCSESIAEHDKPSVPDKLIPPSENQIDTKFELNGNIEVLNGSKNQGNIELIPTTKSFSALSPLPKNSKASKNKSKLKKKLKRRSAWKMGIVRGKKKIKKMTCAITKQQSAIGRSNIIAIPNNDTTYFIDDEEKRDCKLCLFTGKLITAHYVHNHPHSEVYISRLSSEKACAARIESPNSEIIISLNDLHQYACRFCSKTFDGDREVIMDHLAFHTGEFRYGCNICKHKFSKIDSLKHHFKYRHSKDTCEKCPQFLYELPESPELGCGYICNQCNFIQIFEENVKQHATVNHSDLSEPAAISKIRLYTILNKQEEKHSETDKIDKQINESESQKTNENIQEESNCNVSLDISKTVSNVISCVLQNEEKELEQKPTLTGTASEIKKADVVNPTLNEPKISFEPFTKKMTVTDALQNKINSMTEKVLAEISDIKMESANALVNTSVPPVETPLMIAPPAIKVEPSKTNAQLESSDSITDEHIRPVSEEAPETCQTESNIWDEQDSNDSEHSNISNPIENVNDVLQTIEKIGKTPGIMSDTINRLVSNLITSPSKSKNVVYDRTSTPDALNNLGTDQLNVDIKEECTATRTSDVLSSLPPAAPIELNLVKSAKLQIATIRASITSSNEIIYECFERGCAYVSKIEHLFRKHINNCHINSEWNGMCNLCNKCVEIPDMPFQDGYPMAVCFQHMITVHKLDIQNEVLKPKKFLKMRRLSGDQLSISKPITVSAEHIVQPTDKGLPFLKIESVVSLNENYISKSIQQPTQNSLKYTDSKQINSNTDTMPELPELIPICKKKPEENKQDPTETNAIKNYVKPWVKDSDNSRKSMESYTAEKLLELYKCMSDSCTFTSSDKILFQNHLVEHSSNKEKQHNSQGEDYLECAYCSKTCSGIISLIGHIKNSHSCCLYQCRHCFYRCFCKVYINQHIDLFHKELEGPNVISLDISAADIRRWKLSNTGSNLNVLPYQCKLRGCHLFTMCKIEFADHLQTHGISSWTCFICNDNSPSIAGLIAHMKSHELNVYQCCYCVHGAETKQVLLEHIVSSHSEMPASIFMRSSKLSNQSERIFELLKFNLETDKLSTSVIIANDKNMPALNKKKALDNIKTSDQDDKSPKHEMIFNKTVHTSYDSDSDNLVIDERISSDAKTSDTNNKTKCIPEEQPDTELTVADLSTLNEDDENALIDDIPNTEVVCAEDLSNESSKLSNERMTETEDPLCIDQVSFHEEFKKHTKASSNIVESDTANDGFVLVDLLENTKSISLNNTSTDLSGNESADIELLDSDQLLTNHKKESNGLKQTITKESLKSTGIASDCLFKCFKCSKVFDNSGDFKKHCFSTCLKYNTHYSCMHCSKSFKHPNTYVEHVKVHGIHRYGCFTCKYRAARPTDTKLHVIHKHKFSNVEIVPVYPDKSNPDTDLFVCRPKTNDNVTPPPLKKLDTTPTKMNSYTPGDIEKLPRNSIYSREVECALCPFKTKVRTNIIRHLQQHKSENTVPQVCPVNPVPCLMSNERHFDKMTNLACSSHIDKADSTKLSKTQADEKLPQYVNESKRFVCGIPSCTYLTVNEEMLRHHYMALHLNETCYMCPHCSNPTEKYTGSINIDKIMSHLKLHDSRLYKCPYCDYHKSQRHIVERHIADKHPVSVNEIVVVREDSSCPSKVIKKETKVKTWMCGLCDLTTYDRTEIVKHAWESHGMKSQFKCGLCQYRCSYKNSFNNHFSARHEGCPVEIVPVYKRIESAQESETKSVPVEEFQVIDTTPLWSREHSGQRYIRGILLEEEIVEETAPVKTPEKKKNNNKAKTVSPSPEKLKPSTSERRKRKFSVNYREDSDGEEVAAETESFGAIAKKVKSQIDCNSKIEAFKKPDTSANNKPTTTTDLKKSEIDYEISEIIDKKTDKTKESDEVISLSSSDEEDEAICDQPSNFISKTELPPLLDEGNYGIPVDGKYRCPFCEEFYATLDQEMFGHLCNELQYAKYSCSICNSVSWDYKLLKAQCDKTHPNIIALIKELTSDLSIESWITKAIEHQKSIILETSECSDNSNVTSSKSTVMDSDNSILNKSDELDVTPSGQKFSCNFCSYSTNSTGFFERHKKVHLTKVFSCGYCSFGSQGLYRKQIEKHTEKSHTDKEIFIIDNSSKDILRKTLLEVDIPKEDIKKDIGICSEEEDYDKSSIIYVCHYCPKRGSTISDIQEHWENTHKTPKVTSDGKLKKGTSEFKYKVTTEQELIAKSAIKFFNKNIYSCQHCGKKGYSKVLQRHHKAAHSHLPMDFILCTEKPAAFKCDRCSFIVYSETLMKKHFNLTHIGQAISYTKIVDEQISSSCDMKEMPKYQCTYCTETFENLLNMSNHHERFHSHKSMLLKKVSITEKNMTTTRRQLFKCPKCPSVFESYSYICQHIETHVKRYICNYCADGFSLPDTVSLHIQRLHPNSEITNYGIVANTHEILESAISKIKVILEDDESSTKNEIKKRQRSDDYSMGGFNKVCKIESPSSIADDVKPTVRAVAKKSTSKLPGRKQVAMKSTSRQCLISDFDKSDHVVLPVSNYNKHIKYDNSKINTVVSIGGKPMRVHIDNLEPIADIHPKLVLVDLKHQKKNEFI